VLQIGRSLVRFQMVSVDFSLTENYSDRTTALGSNQPLTEMSKKRPGRKADNLTTILGHCHVIWETELPGTLWAPRACNGTETIPVSCSR